MKNTHIRVKQLVGGLYVFMYINYNLYESLTLFWLLFFFILGFIIRMVTITKVRGVLWHTLSTKLQYCWQSNWSDVGRSRRYRNSEIRYNFTDRYLLSQFDETCTRIITFFLVTFNYCYQNEYFDGLCMKQLSFQVYYIICVKHIMIY